MTAKGLIRRARQHKGLTVAQLADAAGVVQSSAYDAEARANPSTYVLAKYGEAMGLQLCVYYIDPATEKIIS